MGIKIKFWSHPCSGWMWCCFRIISAMVYDFFSVVGCAANPFAVFNCIRLCSFMIFSMGKVTVGRLRITCNSRCINFGVLSQAKLQTSVFTRILGEIKLMILCCRITETFENSPFYYMFPRNNNSVSFHSHIIWVAYISLSNIVGR